jgi:hypothetical protein
MGHQDKNLNCRDCRRSFAFSAEDQALSGELGHDEPKRCSTCFQAREHQRRSRGFANHFDHLRSKSPLTFPSSLPVARR